MSWIWSQGFQLCGSICSFHQNFMTRIRAICSLAQWEPLLKWSCCIHVIVCVCVGVVLDFTNNYFSSLCVWVWVLEIFWVCMCGSVVGNLLVTIYSNNFVFIYTYLYMCMFPTTKTYQISMRGKADYGKHTLRKREDDYINP